MNNKGRYILALAGVIASIGGIVIAIPAFLQSRDYMGVIGTILLVGGLVLLAMAWSE